MRRRLTYESAQLDPTAMWNAFVDILALTDPQELDTEQIPAHLVFWYDSEVQNGGHFQYFVNRGLADVPLTIEALRLLGAEAQSQVLSAAYQIALRGKWDPILTVDQYLYEEKESGLDIFNLRYHACKPSVPEILEQHLHENANLYIEFD